MNPTLWPGASIVSEEAGYEEASGLCLVPTTSPNNFVRCSRNRLNKMTAGIPVVFSCGQEKLGGELTMLGEA